MANMEQKVSFKFIIETYQFVKLLILQVLKAFPVNFQFQEYLLRAIPMESRHSNFNTILYSLDKIVFKMRVMKDENEELFKLKHVLRIDYNMSYINKLINRSSDIYQIFLDKLELPKHKIPIGKVDGEIKYKELSFFPHVIHDTRPVKLVESAIENHEKFSLETVQKVELIDIHSLLFGHTRIVSEEERIKKLRYGFMQKVVFHRDIFKEIPEDGSGTSLSVLLHKKSRRLTCSIPLKVLASYIYSSIESNDFKLSVTPVYLGNGETKKQVNIFIPCACCVERRVKDIQNIFIPFRGFITIMEGLYHEKIDFAKMYNDARIVKATGNPDYNVYNCKTYGCKFSRTPYIVSAGHICKAEKCIPNYNESGKGFFHRFYCPNCEVNVCGICFNNKDSHLGETEVCPKKTGLISAEEIEEARKNGFRQCPCCKIMTERDAGCAHMTCSTCLNHWCFDCEQLLPVDPVRRSRYIHKCPNAVPGVQGAYTDPDDAAQIGQFGLIRGDNPEVNPARGHILSQ
jgi:hypothetical protein